MYFPIFFVSLTLVALLRSANAVDCGPYDLRDFYTLDCNIPTDYLAIGDMVFVNVSVDPSHSGTYSFTSSDSQNIHGALFDFPVVNGQGHFTFEFLFAKGNQMWFISDSQANHDTEFRIHVVNGDFPNSLVLTTNVTTVQVGVPVWVNVTALTGVAPTVGMQRWIYFNSADPNLATKDTYTTFSNGIGINYVTFFQLGAQQLTANVTFNGTNSIVSNALPITVTPGAPYNFINASWPGNIKVGVSVPFTFAVVDMGGNPVPSFTQQINATSAFKYGSNPNIQVAPTTTSIQAGVIWATVSVTFLAQTPTFEDATITFISSGMQNLVLNLGTISPGYIKVLKANMIDDTYTAGSEISVYCQGQDISGEDVDYIADVLTVSLPGSKTMVFHNVTPNNEILFYAQTTGVDLPMKVLAQSAGQPDVSTTTNVTINSGYASKIYMSQISPVTFPQGTVIPINVSIYDVYGNLVSDSKANQVTINMTVNGKYHDAFITPSNGRGANNITFAYAGNATVSAYASYDVMSDLQYVTVTATNGISTGSPTGSDSCDVGAEENCALSAAQCASSTVQQACACYANIMSCFVKANCVDGSFVSTITSSCLQICPKSTCSTIQASTSSTTKGGENVNSASFVQPVFYVFSLVLLIFGAL